MNASLLSLFSREARPSRFDRSRAARRGRRLGLEFLEGRAVPAVITVTSLLDTIANDGQVTLREAILAANTDAVVDGSTKGWGADVIQFAPGLTGKISLGGSQLATSTDISIIGPGAGQLTIDARGLSRVLAVNGGTFSMSGLSLTGGFTSDNGGGMSIAAAAQATIAACVITNNTCTGDTCKGGGIFNEGSLALKYATISSNEAKGPQQYDGSGGGVYTSGKFVAESSSLEDNAAPKGGGVFNTGSTCTIADSHFGGNTTNQQSLFYDPYGFGGALYSQTECSLKSTTIVGNISGLFGGGIYSEATLSMDGCAIIGNGSESGAGLTIRRPVSQTVGPGSAVSAAITRCTFSGNYSSLADTSTPSYMYDDSGTYTPPFQGAAAIFAWEAKLALNSSTICDNVSPQWSSAIVSSETSTAYPASDFVSIKSSIVARNNGGSDLFFAYVYKADLDGINHDLEGRPVYHIAQTMSAGVTSSLIQKPGRPAGNDPLAKGHGGFVLGGFRGTGNIVGVDPLLAPLADNGGPTLSYLPLPGSPVINRGITLTTFDQRGTGYVGACGRADMGAVEVQKAGAYLLYHGLAKQLVISGSAVADTISVSKTTNPKGASFFVVTINGQKTSFGTSTINTITVMGFTGNDKITIDATITIDCVVDAGDGDDSVNGGAGADILLGGDGFDTIAGGDGMDLVIGGDGHDVLSGGLAKDIVIGGATLFDNAIDTLKAIRTLWKSGGSFDDRVASLLTGKGGVPPLAADGVSDNFYDQITLDAAGMELVYASDDDDVAPLGGNRKIRVLS